MQQNTPKIQLSKEECSLVTNAQILLTKNAIIKKVYQLFGLIAEQYAIDVNRILPINITAKNPKISRGENYEGLPYVMLDYPRHFLKDDTLAIRSFFWWGNFFSITIQINGHSYNRLLPQLLKAAEESMFDGWYTGINENQWAHHFEESNYKMMNRKELLDSLKSNNSIKLAKKIPLAEWENAENFFQENFKLLISIIRS